MKEKIESINLSEIVLPEVLIKKIPRRLIAKYQFIPINIKDNVLTAAFGEEPSLDTLDEIRTVTNYKIKVVLASKESIHQTIWRSKKKKKKDIKETIVLLIKKHFGVPLCSKCGENKFRIEQISPRGISVQLKCAFCEKPLWIKSVSHSGCPKLVEIAKKSAGAIHYAEVFSTISEEPTREPIPASVKNEVWNRDSGRCVKCGNNENLEFDHIIPVSKGGANTTRNIQLLCEKCNREKGASI